MTDLKTLENLLKNSNYPVNFDVVYASDEITLSVIGDEAVTEFVFDPSTEKLQNVNTHPTVYSD